MALLTSKEKLNVGINVESPYAKIDSLLGGKESLTITLKYYVSQEASESGASSFMQRVFVFKPSLEDGAPNFIKQGYEHIKTFPEFEDAVDVLE